MNIGLGLQIGKIRKGGPPIPSGFNPSDYGTVALWLSDTGTDPATWPDLSGNGNDATQATMSKQPEIVPAALNGRQVRRFDGVDDWLDLDAHVGMLALRTSPYTIFAVAQQANSSGTYSLICASQAGTSKRSYLLAFDTGVLLLQRHNGSASGAVAQSAPNAEFVSIVARFDGVDLALSQNGAAYFTAAASITPRRAGFCSTRSSEPRPAWFFFSTATLPKFSSTLKLSTTPRAQLSSRT